MSHFCWASFLKYLLYSNTQASIGKKLLLEISPSPLPCNIVINSAYFNLVSIAMFFMMNFFWQIYQRNFRICKTGILSDISEGGGGKQICLVSHLFAPSATSPGHQQLNSCSSKIYKYKKYTNTKKIHKHSKCQKNPNATSPGHQQLNLT